MISTQFKYMYSRDEYLYSFLKSLSHTLLLNVLFNEVELHQYICVQAYEPYHKKTCFFLQKQKQRRRTAAAAR